MILSPEDVYQHISAAEGKKCWSVSAGGSAGSRVLLDLGAMRRLPRQNTVGPHCEYVQIYEGEIVAFIRCSWRLDGPKASISSSEAPSELIGVDLRTLIGRTVTTVAATPPAWDLSMTFSGDIELKVFCDEPNGRRSSYNWEIVVGEESMWAGPGYEISRGQRD